MRSGSLITARLAGEQGREVFAVPGSPLDPRARGANSLLRQGATLVEEAADVIEVLDSQGLAEPDGRSYDFDEAAGGEGDAARAAVLGLISTAPVAIDEVARAAGLPTPLVLAALMELALAGRVEMIGGGMVQGL